MKPYLVSVLFLSGVLLSVAGQAQSLSTVGHTFYDDRFLNEVLQQQQEEQIYLRQLSNIRHAVEKELAIVRLIRECAGLDALCTGKGLSIEPWVARAEPPSAPVGRAEPVPATLSHESTPELPQLIRVYGRTAIMRYHDQTLSLRQGDWVGPFRVKTIGLDEVAMQHLDERSYRLLVDWNAGVKP